MSSNRLEKLLTKLYNHPQDRFYSHLFFLVGRVHSDKTKTMGVGAQDGRINLFWNQEFLEDKTDKECIEIIKHEALHLINEHIARGKGAKENDSLKHQMENIAMDCSINQYLDQKIIDKIGGVTLDRFRELLTHKPKNWYPKEKMVYDYYYDLLSQEQQHREKEQGGQGQGGESLEEQLKGMGMDEHGMFGEMDALDRAMLEDKIRKAAENTKADGVGSVPSEVEELLRLKKKPTISWQRELRQFIGANNRAERTTTRSKRNRRYGITFAGYKRDYKAKILVVLDTSGSMGGDRTEKVLSELYGIWKVNPDMELDIVECDAEIQKVFKYDGKEEFQIAGRGGTHMTPALKYAKENKYDGTIFLTDGEFWNEDFKKYKSLQTLWVIANNSGFTSEIGRTVHIKTDN